MSQRDGGTSVIASPPQQQVPQAVQVHHAAGDAAAEADDGDGLAVRDGGGVTEQGPGGFAGGAGSGRGGQVPELGEERRDGACVREHPLPDEVLEAGRREPGLLSHHHEAREALLNEAPRALDRELPLEVVEHVVGEERREGAALLPREVDRAQVRHVGDDVLHLFAGVGGVGGGPGRLHGLGGGGHALVQVDRVLFEEQDAQPGQEVHGGG